jgi:hypothetical protein
VIALFSNRLLIWISSNAAKLINVPLQVSFVHSVVEADFDLLVYVTGIENVCE